MIKNTEHNIISENEHSEVSNSKLNSNEPQIDTLQTKTPPNQFSNDSLQSVNLTEAHELSPIYTEDPEHYDHGDYDEDEEYQERLQSVLNRFPNENSLDSYIECSINSNIKPENNDTNNNNTNSEIPSQKTQNKKVDHHHMYQHLNDDIDKNGKLDYNQTIKNGNIGVNNIRKTQSNTEVILNNRYDVFNHNEENVLVKNKYSRRSHQNMLINMTKNDSFNSDNGMGTVARTDSDICNGNESDEDNESKRHTHDPYFTNNSTPTSANSNQVSGTYADQEVYLNDDITDIMKSQHFLAQHPPNTNTHSTINSTTSDFVNVADSNTVMTSNGVGHEHHQFNGNGSVNSSFGAVESSNSSFRMVSYIIEDEDEETEHTKRYEEDVELKMIDESEHLDDEEEAEDREDADSVTTKHPELNNPDLSIDQHPENTNTVLSECEDKEEKTSYSYMSDFQLTSCISHTYPEPHENVAPNTHNPDQTLSLPNNNDEMTASNVLHNLKNIYNNAYIESNSLLNELDGRSSEDSVEAVIGNGFGADIDNLDLESTMELENDVDKHIDFTHSVHSTNAPSTVAMGVSAPIPIPLSFPRHNDSNTSTPHANANMNVNLTTGANTPPVYSYSYNQFRHQPPLNPNTSNSHSLNPNTPTSHSLNPNHTSNSPNTNTSSPLLMPALSYGSHQSSGVSGSMGVGSADRNSPQLSSRAPPLSHQYHPQHSGRNSFNYGRTSGSNLNTPIGLNTGMGVGVVGNNPASGAISSSRPHLPPTPPTSTGSTPIPSVSTPTSTLLPLNTPMNIYQHPSQHQSQHHQHHQQHQQYQYQAQHQYQHQHPHQNLFSHPPTPPSYFTPPHIDQHQHHQYHHQHQLPSQQPISIQYINDHHQQQQNQQFYQDLSKNVSMSAQLHSNSNVHYRHSYNSDNDSSPTNKLKSNLNSNISVKNDECITVKKNELCPKCKQPNAIIIIGEKVTKICLTCDKNNSEDLTDSDSEIEDEHVEKKNKSKDITKTNRSRKSSDTNQSLVAKSIVKTLMNTQSKPLPTKDQNNKQLDDSNKSRSEITPKEIEQASTISTPITTSENLWSKWINITSLALVTVGAVWAYTHFRKKD